MIDRDKYELDMKCGACVELNMVPDDDELCIYTEKLCSRYENARLFYKTEEEVQYNARCK